MLAGVTVRLAGEEVHKRMTMLRNVHVFLFHVSEEKTVQISGFFSDGLHEFVLYGLSDGDFFAIESQR